MNKSLASEGWRMSAEWERQEAVLLAWPHNPDTWPGRLPQAVLAYLPILRETAESQDVWLIVRDAEMQIEAGRLMTLYGVPQRRIHFHHHTITDSWARDFGPITLVRDHEGRRERLFTDWIFDGWGGKYYANGYGTDDLVPRRIAAARGEALRIIDFVLEGGSIEVNGTGTLITSRSCLLNPNRNVSFTQNQIEDVLKENLGIKKIIWVEEGIAGDDTDGHIDDTVRFVAEDTVVCAFEADPQDANHLPLLTMFDSLSRASLADGRPLRVIKLPMPPHLAYNEQRVPASYANFLILNEKVLVPTYACSQDDVALQILGECFPSRRVIGIDCREIVWGLGAIHCLSQNIPAKT